MVEVGNCLGGNGVCARHAELEHGGDKLRLVLPSAEQGAEVRTVVPDQVGITEHLAAEFVPGLRHGPYSRFRSFQRVSAACKFGAGLMSVGIAANSGFVETATRTATRRLPDRRGQEISSGVAAHESDRSQAILDFLVDDLAEPPPKALLVTFLANACKAVAAPQSARQPVDSWLGGERQWPGIRERPAIVAAFNSGSINKAELADSYCADQPAHAVELAKLLDHLEE